MDPRPERAPMPRFIEAELAPTATIHTLTLSACRWPIGDPHNADFGFCGRDRAGPGSYCQQHAQTAFRRRGEANPRSDQRLERYLAEPRRAHHADAR